MHPPLPCYERGESEVPRLGALLSPDHFSMYRNSDIAKLNSLRDQVFRRVALLSLSGFVCYQSFQSIDSEKSLWSISVRTTFVISGCVSFFSFSTGLQKYFEYVAARHSLAQKIGAYPKHFSMKETCAINRLITPEEFREISPFLPAEIESIEIFASQIRAWRIEGGEMLLGTFTSLKVKEEQVIESDEEHLLKKNRPWIDLTLFTARSQSMPNDTKRELIQVLVDLIIPRQFLSAPRLERKPGELRFSGRQLEGEKIIFAITDSETLRFTKAKALKAFLMRRYPLLRTN